MKMNGTPQKEQECTKGGTAISVSHDSALSNLLNTLELSDSRIVSQVPQNTHSVIEDALSNYAVLRNIFSILNEQDLERCCHVSQYWRTVADPLVLLHYDIQLGKDINIWMTEEDSDRETQKIVIQERARYNRKSFNKYESNFEELTQKLEQALLSQKVSISLNVFYTMNIRKDNVKSFLVKFGSRVRNLAFTTNAALPLNLFCKLLLNNLPNLRKLNCTDLKLYEDAPEDQNFNVDLPKNKHKHLRKISFKSYSTCDPFSFQSFVTLLKIAPNLNEIQRLPLQLIKSVLIAGKGGHVIKSVSYRHDKPWLLERNGETVLTAFQKLAQLQPKLTFFHFLPNAFPVETEDTFEMIKPLVFSILQGSSGSLESLCITPTENYGFQNFPRLEALKNLELSYQADDEGCYFPENISLQDIFPNVREICMGFMWNEENLMERYLPENIISPWGSQIKVLKVMSGLRSISVPLLQRRFSSIHELKLMSSVNQLAELVPALGKFWPGLKSLTVGVDYGYVAGRNDGERPGKLDCVFTGLSEEAVHQLLDPSKRGNLTDEEIQGFKDGSPMSNLKELTQLTLIFTDCEVMGESIGNLTRMTPVANEFGFRLLPRLKVTVGLRNHQLGYKEATKEALEPLLAQSDNIDIDEDYFEGEWSMRRW